MKSFGLGAYVLSGGVAVSLLAGCGGLQTPIAAPYAMPQAPAAAVRTHSRGPALVRSNGDAHKPASFLYLAQCCQQLFSNRGNITLYDLGLTGVARTIIKGVSNPFFITVDRAGRIYYTSWLDYSQGVIEYDAGSESPSRRIKLDGAWTVATDSSNNLYVALCLTCFEYHSGNSSINVYEAGTTKLLRTITKGVDSPLSLAFDTTGNLYVADGAYPHPAVTVYAPGSSKPLRKLTKELTGPSEIAFDPSNNLFVMNGTASGSQQSVIEYAAESDKVLRKITNGVSSPQAIAVDGSGTLYVSNTPYPSQGWVSVYAPGASTPSYQITSDMNDPQLLTVDDEGNLYVGNDYYGSSDSGSLCVYAPKAKTPLRCVATRQYSFPYALAVKPR
jgi:DNA-binding beta-propeller fold protein YncE